jgi:membrane protein implicated in regulation of membrane protease activity
MSSSYEQRGVGELFSDAVDQFTKLIQNEMAIARAELSAKATEAAIGIGLVVGGAVILIPAMVLLLMALAAWLFELGLASSVANLIAGVVGLVISGILAYVGKTRLSPENLKPKRTIREVERDVAAVKEAT